MKFRIKFKDYKNENCLQNYRNILKSQQRFKSKVHNVYTEEIKKISLSNNSDKRLQAFDKTTSYPYGSNVRKVCKTELLRSQNTFFLEIKKYCFVLHKAIEKPFQT